ncbi:hypothetical protein F4604DRAFT_789322 [Suillus subluteus]|nr:hypothetical protein F4604DRAFT_789322 [Suillus subluteus]
MTYSHVDLNLPGQGSSASMVPSQGSAAPYNTGAHAAQSQHPQQLPSPPTTQSQGHHIAHQRLHPPSTQQQGASSSQQQPLTSPASQPTVQGTPSNSTTSRSQTSTAQGSRPPITPNPVTAQPVAMQPSGTQQGPPAANNVRPAAATAAQQDPAAQRRLAERAALEARLRELDAEEANGVPHPAGAPATPIQNLCADPEMVERMRAAAAAAPPSEAKKVALPDLVPGFKANLLDASK